MACLGPHQAASTCLLVYFICTCNSQWRCGFEREDVLVSSTLRLFCMPSLPTGLHAGSCAQSPPFGAVSAFRRSLRLSAQSPPQRSPRRVPTTPNPFWDDQLFPSPFPRTQGTKLPSATSIFRGLTLLGLALTLLRSSQYHVWAHFPR